MPIEWKGHVCYEIKCKYPGEAPDPKNPRRWLCSFHHRKLHGWEDYPSLLEYVDKKNKERGEKT